MKTEHNVEIATWNKTGFVSPVAFTGTETCDISAIYIQRIYFDSFSGNAVKAVKNLVLL